MEFLGGRLVFSGPWKINQVGRISVNAPRNTGWLHKQGSAIQPQKNNEAMNQQRRDKGTIASIVTGLGNLKHTTRIHFNPYLMAELPWRPPQVTSAEQVYMHVEYGLS